MATVKFPSEMPTPTTIKGTDKVLMSNGDNGESMAPQFDQLKQYLSITGIDLNPSDYPPGSALPTGPLGENRRITNVIPGSYTWNGNTYTVPEGYTGTLFWNGSSWSLTTQELPNNTVNDLGVAVDKSLSQNISTQNIRSTSLPLKGVYGSSAEANLQVGESCYNYNTKQIVQRVSDTENIAYTPNLNIEYEHYDGRFFRWNGTDLVEIQKVLSVLGSDEKKPINQNVSSYGFKATSLILKGAYASSTDANLAVGESCYNYNTKQIVSRVNTDLTDRLVFTPIVGTEYLIGNNRYCFNGSDLILSTEERRLRGFRNDFSYPGYAHKTTGVITPYADISNTGFIPCIEGETIRANALRTNGDAAVIVWYDAKKEIISSVTGTNPAGYWMETYVAPAGARFYVANAWNNNKDNSFVDSIWWKLGYFNKTEELIDIYSSISWTDGGVVYKDGAIRLDNPTLRFSDPIKYTGGDITLNSFSGANGALIVFFKDGEFLGSIFGAQFKDKNVYIWEKHIPDGTTDFRVNAEIGKTVSIKVSKSTRAVNLVKSTPVPVVSNKGRYQFGSTANYNVLDTPLQAAFVFRKPNAVYALYDALMAQFPNYITKIDLDADMASIGIDKPAGLSGYTFPMYRFRPSYAAVNPNHDGAQNYNEIKILITTGTHDEPYAIETLYNLMKRICNDWNTDPNMEDLRFNVTFYIIPVSNPWALDQPTAGEEGVVRVNWNGVDLNRNMPTSDWILQGEGTRTYSGPSAGSEYENKILVRQLEVIKPTAYIDFHNYGRDLVGNVTYLTSRDKTALDIIAEFLNKNARNLKKINPDYPQAPETYLGFSQTTPERGGRSVYAVEQGIMGFVYECCPGYVWNNGVLQTEYKRHGDEVVMRDNLMGFTYFVLRVLNEISKRNVV